MAQIRGNLEKKKKGFQGAQAFKILFYPFLENWHPFFLDYYGPFCHFCKKKSIFENPGKTPGGGAINQRGGDAFLKPFFFLPPSPLKGKGMGLKKGAHHSFGLNPLGIRNPLEKAKKLRNPKKPRRGKIFFFDPIEKTTPNLFFFC